MTFYISKVDRFFLSASDFSCSELLMLSCAQEEELNDLIDFINVFGSLVFEVSDFELLKLAIHCIENEPQKSQIIVEFVKYYRGKELSVELSHLIFQREYKSV